MHKPSVSTLVFKTLFPRPRQGDPTTFSAHINRNLVPEVRIETANFYGALDCIEAQYPGLDYSHSPHRRRLSRFPWHKKLFRVFDELCLTRNEILSLCQWEGTKSAKDKYERDVGRFIRDTTMDGIAPAGECRRPIARTNPDSRNWRSAAHLTVADQRLVEDGMEGEDSDGDIDILSTSNSNSLNSHLRSAAEARARGEPGVVPDEQWEQWLKEAMERNELGVDGMLEAIRQGRPFAISPSHIVDATVHPPILSLANTATASHPNAPPASSASAMNDTHTAIVNVWNLGNEIVRNVNAGNAALVASAPSAAAAVTGTAATTASAQPAGEAR